MTLPTSPEFLLGATEFSDDIADLHPLWIVKTLKAQPQFWDELCTATDLEQRAGRKRMSGHWALAYMAFVFSRHSDVQPWWAMINSSVWRAAGFRERPSYKATWTRFAELEDHAEAFLTCAQKLIGHAVKASGGKVGQYVHVDGTEAETHARLEHLCAPGSPCRRKTKVTTRATRQSAAMNTGDARHFRHEAAALPELETIPGHKPVKTEDDEPITDIGDADEVRKDDKGGLRIRVGSCWYRILDETAGVRAYKNKDGTTKRFWVGFYNHKAIDHYTGAPLAVHVTSASVQEYDSYPRLFQKLVEATGKNPEAMVADRGYSVSKVFEHNTKLGVASVIAWRRPHWSITDRAQEDRDRWDRHGIVRCKHCGGPTRKVRFNKTSHSGPRLWVRCQAPRTPGCQQEQTIACKENWRQLIPMWRTDPTYQALRSTHDRYERVHHHWRTRYCVGADDHAMRPKRRGRDCQQLRSNAALIIEWLMILWREGWMGSARRNRNAPSRDHGQTRATRFQKLRAKVGLERPYGPKAVALSNKFTLRPEPLVAEADPPDATGTPSDEPSAERPPPPQLLE